MTEERLWLLVSLKLSGEAGQDELAELESYLLQNPGKKQSIDRVNTLWHARPPASAGRKEEAFNKHLQRLSNHLSEPVLLFESPEMNGETIPEKKQGRPVYRMLAWATGIAASFLIVWFTVFNSHNKIKTADTRAQNEVRTKKGSKTSIRLPDGTEVWLNADSKITYNESFLGDIREVKLEGEAFFDVVRDENRPFIIHTDVIDVKVLGTAFNVRSYADEKSTETSLIRGSVEVILRNNGKTYKLRPNDKLTVDNKQAKETAPEQLQHKKEKEQELLKFSKVKFKENESTAIETLWIKDTLAFDGEPLEKVALMLEKWYDVKVIFKDDKIKKMDYTGTFKDESLPEVLEALRWSNRSFKYDYNRKEKEVILWR